MLVVDLSREKYNVRDIKSADYKLFIGSRGLQANYLWHFVPSHTNPLSPENYIFFGAGPAVGTAIPTAGQTIVTSKSPATNMYFKSNTGGHFGAFLRFSGYDIVAIHERASRGPYTYMLIMKL